MPTQANQRNGERKLSRENAILLAQNIFLRERLDWQMWDLRRMAENTTEMKKIVEAASWEEIAGEECSELLSALGTLQKIIADKDATRVIAGHTHVEQTLQKLSNAVFGL